MLYNIVMVALCTGMRASEITNLKWKHVDLEQQWLFVDKSKNKERRGIYITDELLVVLRGRYKKRDKTKAWVFPSDNVDAPYEFRKLWEKAVEDAGLEDFLFHDLRHTFASYMAQQGTSPLIIQKITGHKNLSSLQRYAHLMKDHTVEAISTMNQNYISGQKK